MASIVSHMRETIRFGSWTRSTAPPLRKRLTWAAARILFVICSGVSVTTVVGCYILSPLFCYWFFGSLRFWRYLHLTLPMVFFTYRLAYLCLRRKSVGSFPLTAPPMSAPDLSAVKINPEWKQGDSCGECGKCCRKIKCPFQDKENGHCMSYDTFYWRYFNCGRYPLNQREIDLYECPKWIMRR
ncbi:MAG: hypothetical protein JXL84_20815 [Deltaproteobacteria bacterium]|nr:hypothetical protein [Deltaproteobacteria bacterium]